MSVKQEPMESIWHPEAIQPVEKLLVLLPSPEDILVKEEPEDILVALEFCEPDVSSTQLTVRSVTD